LFPDIWIGNTRWEREVDAAQNPLKIAAQKGISGDQLR
jgi:hypothetical protein